MKLEDNTKENKNIQQQQQEVNRTETKRKDGFEYIELKILI